MSVRAVGIRLFKHGRSFVQQICKRELNTTISDKINAVSQATAAPPVPKTQAVPRNFALRNVGVQLGLQARRILIDNVLNRVTNSLSAELRKKATRRILFGDSAPFFALVGVSIASGTGILTKEEELEGVCWEIREAISKIKWQYYDIDESRFESNPITLNDLSLGKPIAKGSNGVVYSAKVKENDNIDENKYPFALKMMFNYDIQSNSMEILKAMHRETVPARLYYSNHEDNWEMELARQRKHLPPHPNIVAIFSVFTDYIQEFQDSKDLFPAALPKRIHPEGEARNMSLFLLMKQYNCSLQSFLATTTPSTRTSILLLAQLLEGVAHLNAHGIAHRDLKADNLLLDTTEPESPILVISDFGCCLADKVNGLHLPYTSFEIDKGGNTALMAPEIMNQKPGTFSVLNYTKADLWAVGAISYEIFGSYNPFYGQKRLKNFNYKEQDLPTLPEGVPKIIQSLIGNLLKRNPNKRLDAEVAANVCQLFLWAPSSWLKPGVKIQSSAEILQWLLSLTTKVLCEGKINNKSFGGNFTEGNRGRRTYPEYLLISSFLCRAKLSNVRAALSWIQENISENDC